MSVPVSVVAVRGPACAIGFQRESEYAVFPCRQVVRQIHERGVAELELVGFAEDDLRLEDFAGDDVWKRARELRDVRRARAREILRA